MAKYGFYSQKAVDGGSSTIVYLSSLGEEVEVTEVSDFPVPQGRWDDYVSVGRVEKYLRQGKPPVEETQSMGRLVRKYENVRIQGPNDSLDVDDVLARVMKEKMDEIRKRNSRQRSGEDLRQSRGRDADGRPPF